MSAISFRERFQEICIPSHKLQKGQELGEGTFGKVFLGRYQHMDVAIKELTVKHLPAKAQEEFEKEAIAMKDLRHSNVVLLYGVCIDPSRCLVMEYCARGALYNLLQSNQQIPESKRLTWAAEIAKGLNYLHDRKNPILHRDLKSLNVLINEHNCAKIADFGLSRIKSSSNSTATLKGKMVGTVRWMAPEIMEAEEGTAYTKAADVYSYGMVAWELATRTIPFQGITKEMPFMMKILQGKRQEIPPNTPPPLKQVITGCWKQTPEKRLPLDQVIKILNAASSKPSYSSNQHGGLGSIAPLTKGSDSYGGGLGSLPLSSTPQGGYSPSSYSGAPAPHVPAHSSASSSSSQIAPHSTPSPAPIYSPQTQAPSQTAVPAMAFGKAKWTKYFGDIGTEPPLPKDIRKILQSDCIFWPGKKVRETHLLVLVPNKVNGEAFHLNSLKKLIKHPKTGNKAKYFYYSDYVKKALGNKSEKSHWVLITRDVIPGSRNKIYSNQKALIKRPYSAPSALEIATVIMVHHAETGERVYPSSKHNTYTRCLEDVCNGQYRVTIGSFGSFGLKVAHGGDFYQGKDRGVSAVRKF